jgi:hypothetical protein
VESLRSLAKHLAYKKYMSCLFESLLLLAYLKVVTNGGSGGMVNFIAPFQIRTLSETGRSICI